MARMADKKAYLIEHHARDWVTARQQTETDLSDAQTMFCCCGRLATGLHERYCSRFQKKVDSETVRRLKHLIPKSI